VTQAHGDADVLQAARARNLLIRRVRELLKGSGLDIRELASELVISNPGHPEQGRIYITYVTGEVSHKRVVWDYLGYLDGAAASDPEAEPKVSAETITGRLAQGQGEAS
jgi:hypothetical protein